MTFEEELTQLINKHSMENVADAPDYILAQYMCSCLDAFATASRQQARWYEDQNTEA